MDADALVGVDLQNPANEISREWVEVDVVRDGVIALCVSC